MERNYWGIDVTIYTPRAEYSQDEAGLCTYSGNDGDITHLAWEHKFVLMINRNAKFNNWYYLCRIFFPEYVTPVYRTHMWWRQTQIPVDPLQS